MASRFYQTWKERRADNAFGPSPRTVGEFDRGRAEQAARRKPRVIPPGPGRAKREALPFYHGRPIQKRLA